jgi:hypothetical protein
VCPPVLWVITSSCLAPQGVPKPDRLRKGAQFAMVSEKIIFLATTTHFLTSQPPQRVRLRSELGPRAEFVWLLFWRRCGGCARRGELLGARSAGAAGAVRVCAAEVWAIGGGQGLRTLCSFPEREKHRAPVWQWKSDARRPWGAVNNGGKPRDGEANGARGARIGRDGHHPEGQKGTSSTARAPLAHPRADFHVPPCRISPTKGRRRLAW